MSIITQQELLGIMRADRKRTEPAIKIKYAKVTDVRGGKPVIQFDEDAQPSQKGYLCFTSYTPAVGDRVMLINGVIIGGWRV